jgi:outer membrane protein OmpA-like peptidoglycan-associated protein
MPVVPVATAADAEIARAERDWAEHNPPQADPPDAGTLTLWNFPVGKADLAPEQVEAIEDFVKDFLIQETREHPQSDWVVEGHASLTGTEESNQSLAQRRADNVKAVLTGLGLQVVRAEGTGSAPDPAGNDPQLLARNRRVTIYRKSDGYRTPPKQKKAPPDRPKGLGYDTRVKVKLELRELLGTKVKVTPVVIGELRVFLVDSKSDLVTAGVIAPGSTPALTEEFEKVVGEQVFRANLDLGKPEEKELPPIKVTIQAEEWFQTPKVTYGPGVISFNFKAVNARFLPVVDYNGEQVYLEFTGSIRFDIALLEGVATKYPLSMADPGAKVTAPTEAITGTDTDDPLVIGEVITNASKEASPLAQEDVEKIVLNLARRDGAASQVAAEVLGEVEGEPEWTRRSYYWREKLGEKVGPKAQDEFFKGAKEVTRHLEKLDEKKGAREDNKRDWKGKYNGPQREDFKSIREGAFQKLKGYDEDQGDLPQEIEGL